MPLVTSSSRRTYTRLAAIVSVMALALAYLAYSGMQESKSYYVTIAELQQQQARADGGIYARRLRVAGNVAPGSIKRRGTHVEFVLAEEGRTLPVIYNGAEAPPDTFKDDAQAMAEGKLGHDGVFRARNLQAKCASKYAPQPPAPAAPAAAPLQRSGLAPSAASADPPRSN